MSDLTDIKLVCPNAMKISTHLFSISFLVADREQIVLEPTACGPQFECSRPGVATFLNKGTD